jgi:phosphoglycerol transferase MdoB-like AlkP superfamily enzyme
LSDELLYRQAVQKLKEYDQPFVSYIVSASSHTPFILEGLQDRSKVSIDVGKYKDTYFGYYLEAVNYADYAFGVFIQELKDAGIYDDTAILVFGDHNGLTMYNDELIDFLSYTDSDITEVDLKLNYTKVACGFKIPGIEHIEIEKPVSKLDIKPTLAYLCNLEDTFSLGTNMFANKDFVCLNNERIITSRYYYDAGWYDIKTGEMLKWEELDEDTKKLLDEYYQDMKTELDISNSVSINNLLK